MIHEFLRKYENFRLKTTYNTYMNENVVITVNSSFSLDYSVAVYSLEVIRRYDNNFKSITSNYTQEDVIKIFDDRFLN